MYTSIKTLAHVQELKAEKNYWESIARSQDEEHKNEMKTLRKKLEQEYHQVSYSQLL